MVLEELFLMLSHPQQKKNSACLCVGVFANNLRQ